MRAYILAILLALSGGSAASQTLTVHDAYAWVAPGGRAAVAYFRLENHCYAGQVVSSAHSPFAAHALLHGHDVDEAGTARMTVIENGIPVPAGATVSFGPGRFHVMLLGLQEEFLVGDTVTLTLKLATGRAIDVHAQIRQRGEQASDK